MRRRGARGVWGDPGSALRAVSRVWFFILSVLGSYLRALSRILFYKQPNGHGVDVGEGWAARENLGRPVGGHGAGEAGLMRGLEWELWR